MTHPVYLVDDDAAVRQARTLLLSTVDIPVTGFADPQAFLARLPQPAPGCLILDIRMPVISGLRLQERLADLVIDWPTIVMSGHGDIEACRRAFRNGAIDFLSKPVDEQDLIDAIQKAQAILDRQLDRRAELAETLALLSALTARGRGSGTDRGGFHHRADRRSIGPVSAHGGKPPRGHRRQARHHLAGRDDPARSGGGAAP